MDQLNESMGGGHCEGMAVLNLMMYTGQVSPTDFGGNLQQQGEGFEYHILIIAMSAALVLIGGGKWALDGVIARWLERGDAVSHQSLRKVA